MNTRLKIFTAWTALLVAGMAMASYFAWSPYTDDERDPGDRTQTGPNHK
ncbi:hypothetical protein [Novosphingobium colocasiae]|nr:hypothetical protein [Novosphingobium colocasiae]